MKKKLVAIGGGENGRLLESGQYAPYETETIDKEIVKLAEKEHPNFLFLAHAMDSLDIQESYYQTMKKIYGDKLKCNCMDLKSNELNDINKVKEKIKWADIIYEGGGDTLFMIKLWKETGFDKVLYNAWNEGKVICGISAGAACWFKSCNSDALGNSFSSVNCLEWFDIHFTPHSNEFGRLKSTKKQLKENKLVGVLLPNCVALEIVDDKFKLISDNNDLYGIKAFWNNKYFEKKITISEKLDVLNELISIDRD